jgi:pantoate--beta-alanine ligase
MISSMEIVNRVSRMAAITAKTLVTDVKIGLVPTAGAITPAHISLIQSARKMADLTIVSIFVNRLEFSSEEEYEQYPRDITADVDILRQANVDFVFVPPEDEMYPPSFATYVEVQRSGSELAGLPPPFFKGVGTGALKMLHLIKPAYSFYGEPNALQGAILRKLIRDLNISTEVVISPVEREASGLAYSGNNRLLSETQLVEAVIFYRSLLGAQNAIASGEANSKKILAEMARIMETEPHAKLEYAAILDPELLEPVSKIQQQVLLAVGGKIGNISRHDAILT